MNLTSISQAIRSAFGAVGYIQSLYEGDVYDHWNNNEVQYHSACFALESVETKEDVKAYNLIVYVADRLTEDCSNRVQCFDTSEAAIEKMLNILTDSGRSDNLWVEDTRQYTPFEQKFADNLAGVYVRIKLNTTNELNLC